jgi:hypothetical protein
LLVQYQLLKMGIDSARMTTDAGVDLVVYAPGDRSASTEGYSRSLAHLDRLAICGAPS